MSLMDLLQAAGGVLGRGPLRTWAEAVSRAVGSTEALNLQYAYGKGIVAQAVALNTDLDFEGVGLVNGIPRSAGAPDDSWVLTPGKVYVLRAGGYFDTFSNATGGSVRIQWVDDTATPLESGVGVDCPNAVFFPTTNTAAQSTAALVEIIYLCPDSLTGRVVKCRCTAATGTASKPASVWWASLVEIPTTA